MQAFSCKGVAGGPTWLAPKRVKGSVWRAGCSPSPWAPPLLTPDSLGTQGTAAGDQGRAGRPKVSLGQPGPGTSPSPRPVLPWPSPAPRPPDTAFSGSLPIGGALFLMSSCCLSLSLSVQAHSGQVRAEISTCSPASPSCCRAGQGPPPSSLALRLSCPPPLGPPLPLVPAASRSSCRCRICYSDTSGPQEDQYPPNIAVKVNHSYCSVPVSGGPEAAPGLPRGRWGQHPLGLN